jgi:hypothetical protein
MCLDQPQTATAVGADTNPLPCRQIQRPEPMHLVFPDVFAGGSPPNGQNVNHPLPAADALNSDIIRAIRCQAGVTS